MWAKNSGKISLLTDYRIFWNPQIRYKRSPTYHWVSKLSQKWLLEVKNQMKSGNNRSHVNKSLHLGLCSWEFSIHTSLTLNFKWLVQIINSPFTHLPDSVKEYNRLWQCYYSCQMIMGSAVKSCVQGNSMHVLGSQWYWYTDSHSMGVTAVTLTPCTGEVQTRYEYWNYRDLMQANFSMCWSPCALLLEQDWITENIHSYLALRASPRSSEWETKDAVVLQNCQDR